MTHRAERFAPRPDVRYRRVGNEAVVVRQEAGEVVVLNEVATRILELVDQGRSTGEMIETLVGEFDVERDRLAADLKAFLAELQAGGLIAEVTP